MASSGAGMEGIFPSSLGMAQKIGSETEAFKWLRWMFRAEVINFEGRFRDMYRDIIHNKLVVNDAIELFKEITEFIEMDKQTWDLLMCKVHERDFQGAGDLISTLMYVAAVNENVNVFMTRSKDDLVEVKDFWSWKNFKDLKHMRGIAPDSVAEKFPSGKDKFKSPWQYIKEQYEKHGPEDSGISAKYIQKQEDRIKDLKLAFETGPSWVSVMITRKRKAGHL